MFNVLSAIAAQAQVFHQHIDDASMIMNGAYSQWFIRRSCIRTPTSKSDFVILTFVVVS